VTGVTDGAGVHHRERAAGDFSTWTHVALGAVRGERAADVPCDGCTACCRASQFVHIAPDEHDTLAHIPPALLFPAPMMPRGHVVLGYDERGHCPMLVDDRCSIYAHRPRTCRAYDCRVLAAARIDADDDADDAPKAELMRRVRSWRFDYADTEARVRHDAVRAAARFLAAHAPELPDGSVPVNATQRAGLALEIHEHFLAAGAGGGREVVEPAVAVVRAALESLRTAPARG